MFDEFKNAFNRYNNAHVQLIIINVVIFLAMVLLYGLFTITDFMAGWRVVEKAFVLPARFSDFLAQPWTLITYAFAHNWRDIWHIVWNMLSLYWFGRLFVEYLGNDKLIAVYVLGALAGGIFYLLIYNSIPYYSGHMPLLGLVGASAAVFAVMTAIVTLIPDYTFFLLLLGPVKIKYIALFFVVTSFIGITGGGNEGGNLAHLGGLLIGFTYTKQLQAGVNWGSWITATLGWINNLFKPSSKVKVTYRKAEPVSKAKATGQPKQPKQSFNKATQEEIDAILDKISDKGYESLTKEEKEKLFNASKK